MNWKMPFGTEGLKNIKKTHLLIAVLLGILLLVIAIPTEKNTKQEENTAETAEDSKEKQEQSSYQKSMERQLESMIEAMAGAGKAEVMITLKDEGENVVEKDQTRTEEYITEEDAEGTKRESRNTESQEETIYSEEGSAGKSPYVAKQVNPRVEGVLVVVQGGKNAAVVKNISDAISALFPVEAHKIKVVEMKE